MASLRHTSTSLRNFLARVREQMLLSARDPKFTEHQASLLVRTVELYFQGASGDDWAHPLGLFHASYRMFAGEIDQKGLLVAESCSYFLLSLDLFDDVQDEDLDGKHYEVEGPAVATNSALALLFLAQDALRRAAELEQIEARRLACVRVVNRISLLAIGAQHQDLTSSSTHPSPQEVLQMHAGKTSAVQMVAECGALAAGAPLEAAETMGRFGSRLAVLTQIVDDVRDVFGKEESPDLRSNKATYLRACFDERATDADRAEYARLRDLLGEPGTLEMMRSLYAESGALDACAEAAEEARVEMHSLITKLDAPRAHKRILLSVVDSLANLLYAPGRLAESASIFEGLDGFHARVREQANLFRLRLGVFEDDVRFEPWPRPFFLYDPGVKVVHYPDLDDLSEETLPAYASLFGGDQARALEHLSETLPLLVAHELFHAWRDRVSRLGSDAWHEEYVANALALEYLRTFDRPSYERSLEACAAIRATPLPLDSDLKVRKILAQALGSGGLDYETTLAEAAHVHAQMCLDMPRASVPELMQRWLSLGMGVAAE